MSNDMTAEQAIEKLKSLSGPDGIPALKEALVKSIEQRKMQIVSVQGSIEGLQQSLRMVSAFEMAFNNGIASRKEGVAQSGATPLSPPVAEPITPPEIIERLEKGLCIYKDRNPPHGTGKFCQRKLKTKDEKSSGYCSVHSTHLES